MNALYGLFNAGLAIAAYALLPKEYSEYIALGLIIFISSINRWELNKILKALKANTKSKSEVLNIPRVSGSFTCAGCKHDLPLSMQVRTKGYCYLCDPNITLEECLSDEPLEGYNYR